MRLPLPSNPKVRALLWQVLLAAALGVIAWFLINNLTANLAKRGISFGYDFLSGPAGFDIGELPIAYDADSSYWMAFLVGILNTLRVALLGIAAATALGLLIAIGALSKNPLLVGLCKSYVEILRNIPLLVQLFFLVPAACNPSAQSTRTL